MTLSLIGLLPYKKVDPRPQLMLNIWLFSLREKTELLRNSLESQSKRKLLCATLEVRGTIILPNCVKNWNKPTYSPHYAEVVTPNPGQHIS